MITLEMAKLHQRIDGDDEDDLLQLLLDAAVDDCVFYLNRGVYESQDAKLEAILAGDLMAEDGLVINAPIKAAMLLMFGHLYVHREDGAGGNALPPNARRILDAYRLMPGV